LSEAIASPTKYGLALDMLFLALAKMISKLVQFNFSADAHCINKEILIEDLYFFTIDFIINNHVSIGWSKTNPNHEIYEIVDSPIFNCWRDNILQRQEVSKT
jgi:hypothetical protein